MEKIYDVAIIGGGPAGSTAATLLARAGHSVIVLEKEKFPRFHIGESLLPYSMPILERLGLREVMDRTFLEKHGAELATSCGERSVKFYFKNGFRLKYTSAYQVERSQFDQILLDHSAKSGAEVRQETAVERIQFEPETVRLTLRSASGAPNLQARYLIDASGRNSIIGQQLKLKESYPQLNKFSVFAHFEGVLRDPGPDATLTRMIRGVDRWFWMIPLGTSKMSIGMVMDTAEFKKLGQAPEPALSEAIAREPVIQARMSKAKRVTQVYSTGDYSYRNSSFVGERWIMTGDAAGFIDPVFSTGVFLALNSAEAAADAIDLALKKPSRRRRLFASYERRLMRVMDLYLRFVDSWYRHEFAEVISQPTERFELAPAINSILAGRIEGSFAVWWRMQLFYLVVFLQRFYPLCPRLSLRPFAPGSATATEATDRTNPPPNPPSEPVHTGQPA